MSDHIPADPVVLVPTTRLRIVPAGGQDIPRLIRPGWPECRPDYFKLQQFWADYSSNVAVDADEGEWRDIEVIE